MDETLKTLTAALATLTGDARTAADTALCRLAELGATPTPAAYAWAVAEARSALASAPSYLAERWLPAYALAAGAY